jgi:hypothetical protein
MSSGHQAFPGGYSGQKEHKRWAQLIKNKVTLPTSLVEQNKRNTQEQEKLGHSNFTSYSTDKLKTEISTLNDIQIDRCFFEKQGKLPLKLELFAFGDASVKSYATAIYIVGTHEDGSFSTNLVYSKSRVAPKKMVENKEDSLSIVRLELLAAVITARAANYVQVALEKQYKVDAVQFFTDSHINHCRIKNPASQYKIWEANRLEEIHKYNNKPAQWHHCAGPQNPADLPLRGLTAAELKNSKMWWHGPPWLFQKVWLAEEKERRKVGILYFHLKFNANEIQSNQKFQCSTKSK